MPRLLRLVLCALVLPIAACDSGEDESGLASASFSIQVSDGPTRIYTNAAYFSEAAQDGMSAFGVVLGAVSEAQTEQPPLTAGLVRLGATPGPGAYSVADILADVPDVTGFQGFYIDPDQLSEDFDPFDLSGFFYARSGSVTLSRVERRESVEGEFSMSVQSVRIEGFDPDDPTGGNPTVEPTGEPFQVTGAFNAAFDADLFGDVEFPDTPLARRLAVPPGLIRLPRLSR